MSRTYLKNNCRLHYVNFFFLAYFFKNVFSTLQALNIVQVIRYDAQLLIFIQNPLFITIVKLNIFIFAFCFTDICGWLNIKKNFFIFILYSVKQFYQINFFRKKEKRQQHDLIVPFFWNSHNYFVIKYFTHKQICKNKCSFNK